MGDREKRRVGRSEGKVVMKQRSIEKEEKERRGKKWTGTKERREGTERDRQESEGARERVGRKGSGGRDKRCERREPGHGGCPNTGWAAALLVPPSSTIPWPSLSVLGSVGAFQESSQESYSSVGLG